ncbi:MAG: hypothetical protein ABIE42_01510 [Candidatus Eisenbacteria bacterium]
MERDIIRRHFESIGARVRFRTLERGSRPGGGASRRSFAIDIVKDRRGSIFDVAQASSAPELLVLQARPKERHLLLYSRDGRRFLCGHDERDWFVAAVPKRVSTVRDARVALMPDAVWEKARKLAPAATRKRKNHVFKRQGEWFFVPVELQFPEELIHRNEPLQRTAWSKPHVCEELYREGGELVYIVRDSVYTEEHYKRKRAQDKRFAQLRAETRTRNPEIYVRGNVRHADHATIHLEGWHRVYINAELTLQGSVAYLD